MTTSILDALEGRPVVLCVGSGGVGKTTTSAVLALALAQQGERVVVLTIDPARRLLDALGLTDTGDDLQPVPGLARNSGSVTATMLDPNSVLRQIIERDAASTDQAERILTNHLFANLSSRLSGTSEYVAAERLYQLHNDERFDRVIVDTPPSNHTFDFLDSPARLARFFGHPLYRAVLGRRSTSRLGGRKLWAQAMARLLARLVGATLVNDVLELFSSLAGIDEGFKTRAAAIDEVLASTLTATVLVTTPRSDRLAEAALMFEGLKSRGRSLDAVVFNRVMTLAPDAAKSLNGDHNDPLQQNLSQLLSVAEYQQRAIEALLSSFDGHLDIPAVKLAEQRRPVADIEDLLTMSEAVIEGT